MAVCVQFGTDRSRQQIINIGTETTDSVTQGLILKFGIITADYATKRLLLKFGTATADSVQLETDQSKQQILT